MKISQHLSFVTLLLLLTSPLAGQTLLSNKQGIALSAIKGTDSKSDTIELSLKKGTVAISDIKITGENSTFFKIAAKPKNVSAARAGNLVIVFHPREDFIGIANATLTVKKLSFTLPLSGLSTKGLEGENEPPLDEIVKTLGYHINLGWKTLANNLHPTRQGDELASALFKKSDITKPVEMIPVARYSPDFPVNFGIYTNTGNGPRQHQTGILASADKYPEHQTLFPEYSKHASLYDPQDNEFGFYAISPSHTAYSEDIWNILFYPKHAAHAMRIFPVRTQAGTVLQDTYLVSMEEAANGDYNDYVFLVRNVKPVFIDQSYTTLLNGKNLDGWYKWLESKGKNNDPEKNFTIEADGILHDTGKELGYMITEKSFGNFHFTLEFKWGDKRWPPRDNAKRDSGICYNVPSDAKDEIWPPSIECQIQEGDVGDFWLLGYSTIQVDGKQNAPYRHTQVVKKKDAEKPKGEWNTVEVISFNGKCVHIVNGVVVNYGENASLVGGRILLQSEYAEVFYRNVRLRSL